ncbi:MAG: reactive intermediate/imine deaminase [Candidatus Azotimanducaceae bacterium]|jgi:reactive intermediate/imine deaminase
MTKKIISTTEAPAAIGTYSQAVAAHGCLYISGQIPLVASTMEIVSENIEDQISQVFVNLAAICKAADTDLNQVIKFTIYLIDLSHFAKVNQFMEALLQTPYPARAVVEVSALPKGVQIEIDAVVAL